MNAQAKTQEEKAIDKIRKLLSHANDNAAGSEHERDNAMRMALKLLAKHNLTMADVAIEDKEDRESITIEQFPCPYRKVIAHAISQLYFSKFFHEKVPNKQKFLFHFVGLESNIMTTKEMTLYLIKSVLDESIKLYGRAPGQAQALATTFRNAASKRIAERCEELRAEAEAEHQVESPGTALVLANLYETEKAANENYVVNILGIKDLKKTTVKLANKSQRAAAAGREFGDKINLSNQINGSTEQAAPVAGLIS
jgi:hypothetical protein